MANDKQDAPSVIHGKNSALSKSVHLRVAEKRVRCGHSTDQVRWAEDTDVVTCKVCLNPPDITGRAKSPAPLSQERMAKVRRGLRDLAQGKHKSLKEVQKTVERAHNAEAMMRKNLDTLAVNHLLLEKERDRLKDSIDKLAQKWAESSVSATSLRAQLAQAQAQRQATDELLEEIRDGLNTETSGEDVTADPYRSMWQIQQRIVNHPRLLQSLANGAAGKDGG